MAELDKLAGAVKQTLRDSSRALVFDDKDAILYSSFEANLKELSQLRSTFDDRDSAIRNGLTVQGKRYEVHRYHPPLAYGRTMDTPPETSEGCALCRVAQGPSGCPAYAVITYEMPNISARMVPQLIQFCKDDLGHI